MSVETICALVPARDKNWYSEDGDLAAFGGLTLLEWKLAQLVEVFEPGDVWVTTDSERVASVAAGRGVNALERGPNTDMPSALRQAAQTMHTDALLVAPTTSPYLGAPDIAEILEAYRRRGDDHDSVTTVRKMHEYVVYDGQPLNFSVTDVVSRRDLKAVLRLTNGCYVVSSAVALAGRLWGDSPLYFEVDRLSSYEVKDVDDLVIANELLAMYYKQKELVRK